MPKNKPTTNGPVGKVLTRTKTGTFARGNAGGPGNPHAMATANLRAHLLNTVSLADWEDVTRTLVAMAKAGDIAAIRELLDRGLGKPHQTATIDTPDRPANQDAKIVLAYLALKVDQTLWAPGILARFEAGMIEGHPRQVKE